MKKRVVLAIVIILGIALAIFNHNHIWKSLTDFWLRGALLLLGVTTIFLLAAIIWGIVSRWPRTAAAGGRATPPRRPPTPPRPVSQQSLSGIVRNMWNTWTKKIAFALVAFYTIIAFAVWGYTGNRAVPWWSLIVILGVGHLLLSTKVITETQRGALIFLGIILDELDSGPQLELWPFFRIHIETKNSIQVDFGTVDKETINRAARSENKESWYVMTEPVRINWAGISSVKDVTAEEKKLYKEDLYAQELTTDPHLYFVIKIANLTELLREIGGLEQAIDRIRDVCVTALSEYAGKTFLAKARGEIESLSEDIKKRVEDLVWDPQAILREMKKPPEERKEIIPWGINVLAVRIIDLGTPRRTNEAAADRAATIARADGEARAKVTNAIAARREAEEKAEADGYSKITLAAAEQLELVAKGEGKAEARKLELAGEAQGLETIELTAGVDATTYLQLQTLKEGFSKGNTVFLPNTEVGAILAAVLSAKDKKQDNPPPPSR